MISISARILAMAGDEVQNPERRTKHEALPAEVWVHLGICDRLVETNGVREFTKIESLQVGDQMVKGIPPSERLRVLLAVATNLHTGENLMFVDKVYDVVRRVGGLDRRGGGLGDRRASVRVTGMWIAPWIPVGGLGGG